MTPETKIVYQVEIAYRIKDGAYSSLNTDLKGGTLIIDDSNNFIIKSNTGDIDFIGEISKTTFQVSGYTVILWCGKQIEVTPHLFMVGKGGTTKKEFKELLLFGAFWNVLKNYDSINASFIEGRRSIKKNKPYLKKQIRNIKMLLSSKGAKKRTSKILYLAIIFIIVFFALLFLLRIDLCEYNLIGCNI